MLSQEAGVSPGARNTHQGSGRLEDNSVFLGSDIMKIALRACLQTRRNNACIQHVAFYVQCYCAGQSFVRT